MEEQVRVGSAWVVGAGGELGAGGVAQRVYTVPPASLQDNWGQTRVVRGKGDWFGKEGGL